MSPRSSEPGALFDAARGGDKGSLARLLSLVERGGDTARQVSRLAHRDDGRAYVVGVTGAPGAGKSTLTAALVGHVRSMGDRVAVLAIDPSSPFTGGAILGDRVRMQEHATDEGVFIRSMATRGHLGGLSLATSESIRVLDAVGYPWVIVETVGVGQVEVEIAGKADTTVVVVNPGWGDSVQANKAGLLEVADVFAINKADRPGTERTRTDLEQMLELSELGADAWRPPILECVATEATGVAELWSAVVAHRDHSTASGVLAERRRRRAREELRELVERRLEVRARAMREREGWSAIEDDVAAGRRDPWDAADELLRGIGA